MKKLLAFTSGDSLHLPQINLLRGLAALMVALYHFAWFATNDGPIFPETHWAHVIGKYGCQGVYIFFVISGFVIPLSMYKGNYLLKKAGKFLLKRSIRIEPPYLASIALIIGVNLYFAKLWGLHYPVDFKRILLHVGYLIPFTGGKYEWYGVIFWTLAVEFQYYLLMALLFPLLNHRRRIFRYLVFALFLSGPFMTTNAAFIPLQGPCFALGFILFLLKTDRLNVWELGVLLAACIGMNTYFQKPEIVISTTFAFLFIWKVYTDTKPGNGLGAISYSLYLTHPIIGLNILALNLDPTDTYAQKLLLIGITTLICIACATVFWFFFERPSKLLSQRIKV